MNMKTMVATLVAIGSVGFAGRAAAGVVYLVRGDGDAGRSFATGDNWSDGQVPNSNSDYLVALGGDEGGDLATAQYMNMAAYGSDKVFGGYSLTLGDLDGAGGFVRHRTTRKLTYTLLTLNKGCYYADVTGSSTLAGTWTVCSPTTDPFSFTSKAGDMVFNIEAAISGSAGTCLQVRSATFVSSESSMTKLVISGDNAAYYGQFKAKNPKKKLCFEGGSSIGSNPDYAVALADRGVLVCNATISGYDSSKKIWVEDTDGCLEVPENENCSFDMTAAGEGVLRKTGAGTLIFGGILDGVPLEVAEGVLEWTSSAILSNGVSVSVLVGGVLTGSPEVLVDLPVTVKAGGLVTSLSLYDNLNLSHATFEANGGVMAHIDPEGPYSSVVTIDKTCQVSWPMCLALDSAYPAEGGADSYPVVRIPTELKVVSKSDFLIAGGVSAPAGVLLDVSIENDGSLQTVSIRRKGAPISLVVGKYAAANTFANGDVWSDSNPAHSGADYLVYADTTRRDVASGDDFDVAAVFPGESLTLQGTPSSYKAGLFAMTHSLTVEELRMKGYSELVAIGGESDSTLNVAGNIYVDASLAEGGAAIRTWQDRTIEISAKLFGSADAYVAIYPYNDYNGIHHCNLLGDNSGYFGTIDVYQLGFGTPSLSKHMELIIGDETNLGGNPPSFRFDALILRSYCCLRARNSLVIDDENRGIFANGRESDKSHRGVQFAVDEGDEMTILSHLTISGGTVYKMGAGTWKLGGRIRFGSNGEAANPGTDATRAIIQVSEGAFQPLKGALCEKVKLRIAETGCLRVAPQDPLADDDLKTKGIVISTGDLAPVTSGEKINIDLEFDDSAPSMRTSTFVIPLLTVPTALADQIRGNLSFSHTQAESHSVSFLEREVAEGVQFYAQYKGGFAFIIR